VLGPPEKRQRCGASLPERRYASEAKDPLLRFALHSRSDALCSTDFSTWAAAACDSVCKKITTQTLARPTLRSLTTNSPRKRGVARYVQARRSNRQALFLSTTCGWQLRKRESAVQSPVSGRVLDYALEAGCNNRGRRGRFSSSLRDGPGQIAGGEQLLCSRHRCCLIMFPRAIA